jgi:hypothetical protein
MKRRNAKQRKLNDKKFFENLARKQNPIRFRMALPSDVADLTSVDWRESVQEAGFRRLAELDSDFAAKELAWLRARCKALEAIIAADREAK